MKKVLMFVQAKGEHPELTKLQLCKMIEISDSSIMKDLNMKSFYRHEVPVNRKKTDLTVNKKIDKVLRSYLPLVELCCIQRVDLYILTKCLNWKRRQL
jgi:hypothetical protein